MNVRLSWMLTSVILLPHLFASVAASEKVDFSRDIRPVLARRCLSCHGLDEKARLAGLRLDIRSNSVTRLDSGVTAIVPGDPDNSAVIARITNDDEGLRMPPAESGEPLTRQQIDLFRRWIQQGANYAQHWSYVVPVRPDLPQIDDDFPIWSKSSIDRFLLDRMQQNGLRPSGLADRYALVRRVFLDLTGLPPTIKEADAFSASKNPDAYEVLVDDLLRRDTFGEHWARKWLDLARYADSAGYADDPPRTIWAYRDWVIRAINSNMPFDQFTMEQMAGDLLPNPTRDQEIATAFHRNTLTNSEGGTIDEEFRNVAIVDRVNTTMAVWMGTTMACAQCHSHKYDPITQEEYFRVFAILNNTEDADRRDEAPVIEIFSCEDRARRKALQAEISHLESVFASDTDTLAASLAAWEDRTRTPPVWIAGIPDSFVRASGKDDSVIAADGHVLHTEPADTDTYTVDVSLSPDASDSVSSIAAIRIESIPHRSLPNGGAGTGAGNFVITGIKASVIPDKPGPTAGRSPKVTQHSKEHASDDSREIHFVTAFADHSQQDFNPTDVIVGKTGATDGWAIGTEVSVPHQLVVISESPVPVHGPSTLRIIVEQNSMHQPYLLASFRLSVTQDPTAVQRSLLPKEYTTILDLPVERRSVADRDKLATYYRREIAPELNDQRSMLARARAELASLKPVTTVPVLRELQEDRRETHLQFRGNWQITGHRIDEGVPLAFNPTQDEQPKDRRALADWLTSESNPLTARVLVNRCWEALFGRGLVGTSEDFGTQGELPTHPELLDWLATEVNRLGWDRKAILKQIVMSAAYRQDSKVTPESAAADPDNRWLARGPRVRLSAEMVRDQALFVSGLLSPKMYGPPVKPPQPNLGLKAAFGSTVDWSTSEGEDRYRRALYTTWRRSNPYPSMATFDAPSRDVCTIRRNRSNTPLQSLVTLNDPVYVEAAQSLARIALQQSSTSEERVRFVFRRCLLRQPREHELAVLVRLCDDCGKYLAANAQETEKLATDPLGMLPAGMNVEDAAALTVVGNVLLNLDEMFLKR